MAVSPAGHCTYATKFEQERLAAHLSPRTELARPVDRKAARHRDVATRRVRRPHLVRYQPSSWRAPSHRERTTSPAGSVRAMAADCPAQAWIRSMSFALVPTSRITVVSPRCTG